MFSSQPGRIAGAGLDIQRALQNADKDAIQVEGNEVKLLPLFDIGATGKLVFRLSGRLEAGLLYRQGVNNLLRPEDADRVELIASPVQEVPLDVFSELESGDILFIDSKHVLKTGSDVHYELFSVLPCLRPGVLIHFHDIQYPFEYPRKWVFENNNSWNEIYALRAFLMYNNEFRVLFWCSMLARANRPLLVSTFPLVLRNSGGSIWIEKVGASYRQSEGTPSNSVRSPCF